MLNYSLCQEYVEGVIMWPVFHQSSYTLGLQPSRHDNDLWNVDLITLKLENRRKRLAFNQNGSQ